ncbi:MAG: hypothetical protein ACREBV_04490 [Candidatus Zixiibacteriota bacterium]
MKTLFFSLFVLCSITSCIRTPKEIFVYRSHNLIDLESPQDSITERYFRKWSELDIQTNVWVIYGYNLTLDNDSSLVLLDLEVFPKSATEKITFYPNLIKVISGIDTLKIVKAKKECKENSDACSYLSTFRLTPSSMLVGERFSDTVYFSFDLSNALKLDSTSIEFGTINGRFARSLPYVKRVPADN